MTALFYVLGAIALVAGMAWLAWRWLLSEADHEITALSDSHAEVKELR